MEDKFQAKFKEECSEQERLWKINCVCDITEDLFHSTLERSYRNFFRKGEYKYLVQKAEKVALDKLFLELVDADNNFEYDDENPGKLEVKLEWKFEQIWENEIVNASQETELQKDVESLLKSTLKKRFFEKGLFL